MICGVFVDLYSNNSITTYLKDFVIIRNFYMNTIEEILIDSTYLLDEYGGF
jgi:hypothetical protein